MINRLAFVVALSFAAAAFAHAAPITPARPAAWDAGLVTEDRVETRYFGALDLQAISYEDATRESAGQPQRFAIPHESAVTPHSAGTWEQVGATSVWRYHVHADSAASLNFGFTRYRLPPSAKLYVYDPSHKLVAGPYGPEHNEPHGQLWTPIIAGTDATIELDVASTERASVELLLGRINQGYRGLGTASKNYAQPHLPAAQPGGKQCSPDQVNSGACNMDVACLGPNDPWNDPRRSVGAITLNGSDNCTGSLINNTANDRRMLFITASHCGLTAGTSPTVVVYWNYEWPTCRTPGSAASGQSNPPNPAMSNSGATFVANTPNPFSAAACPAGSAAQCSDNTLVQLNTPANPAFNLYWEGWDRRTTAALCSQSAVDPTSTVGLCAGIHHPNVDEKRITFVKRDFEVGQIANGSNTHWHAFWDATPPILPNIQPPPASVVPGVTEPGSSGSPLYTAEKRLIGVLSGGPSVCGATGDNLSDFYGQLALAWDGQGTPTTRMKDHLDPLGTAPLFIDGIGMTPFTLSLTPPSLAVCASAGSATSTVNVTADVGFSGSVTLSSSGAPAGASLGFAPNPVTPPGNSTYTIGTLGSATPGTYSITITGTSGPDSTNQTLAFALNDVAPGVVTPSAPADNATAVSTTPALSWSAASGGGPQDYQVQVATDSGFTNVVFNQVVHGTTSVNVTPALLNSTDYYWRVTPSNACGAAAASATFHFRTIGAPGACEAGTAPRSVFADDVEAGANGWTTTGSTGASTWAISTVRANSPTHAWLATDIATVSDQRLISPTIALPASENPLTLQFQTWRLIEANTATSCYDGGALEVSTDGGSTFTAVPDASIFAGGAYTGLVSTQYQNPLGGRSAWCGNTARPYTDGPVKVDVSSYAGQSVQFRFRLGTDTSVSKEGWYVDDVSVSSCATTDLFFANGFE